MNRKTRINSPKRGGNNETNQLLKDIKAINDEQQKKQQEDFKLLLDEQQKKQQEDFKLLLDEQQKKQQEDFKLLLDEQQKKQQEDFNKLDRRLNKLDRRLKDLEEDQRTYASIARATRGMKIFEKMPYELQGNAFTEDIKEYY